MSSEIFSPLELHSFWTIQSPAADSNEHAACSDQIKMSNTNPCLVCGGEGRCVNYGGFTCLACRAFFRRHGLRPKRIPTCPRNGQCEVNVNIQKQASCIACRLSKCFSVGMSANFIPQETAKSRRGRPVSRKMESQEIAVHPSEEVCGNTDPVLQVPTFDHFSTPRADLTARESTSLSNILHAYDKFSAIPHARWLVERLSLPQFSQASTQMHLIEHATSAIRSFMSAVPDFQILTTGEQCSLLERNWHVMSGLNCILVLRDSGLVDSSQFMSDALSVYGSDIVSRARQLRTRLDLDSMLIKLMFVIHAFSSNCLIMKVPRIKQNDSLLLGTFRLLGSQNFFVELVWKYMMYRYGYRETVLRFASLVKHMLDTIKHVTVLYAFDELHHQFVDEEFDKKKISMFTKQSTFVPVWGNA